LIQYILFLGILILNLLPAQGRSLPNFIYGPAASAYQIDGDSVIVKKLKHGKRLDKNLYISSNDEKTFILICEETLLELLPESKIFIDRAAKHFKIISGYVIVHSQSENADFCNTISVDDGFIGYIGHKRLKSKINYKNHILSNGEFFPQTDYVKVNKSFIRENRRDANYVLSQIYNYDIPTMQKEFNLPSKRDKNFRFSSKEKTGTVSYKSDTYYHFGSYLKLRMQELEFVYNLWLAFSTADGFYTKNWDEWQDFVNNIHYLQIFHPTDPLSLRIGMVEKLEFGRGYLVDNYNNTVLIPFENLSGFQIKIANRNFNSNVFINDLTRPKIGGFYYSKRASKRLNFDITYVGDFNQYSNILDSDNDSYPDKVDPQPETKNAKSDSIILAEKPISLNNIENTQLHSIGLGLKYQIANISDSDIFITGDLGLLNTPGIGISFPNLFIGNTMYEFGIGADWQSPDFATAIFDRSYEYNKARFIKNGDGEYELISRIRAIDEEGDWYNGWNTHFNLNFGKQFNLKTKYRQVNRGEEYNKHVTLSVKSRYSFSDYLKSYSFFLDNKNFDKLFEEKVDGQIYGFKIYLRPHIALDVDIRYRQQYRDKDGDGEIQGKDVERNFSLNIILDTEYWWNKYRDRNN